MKIRYLFCGLLMTLLSCPGYAQIDHEADAETRALYQTLQKLSVKGILFGHQSDLRQGIHFSDKSQMSGQSDVYTALSDYPALFGFDFAQGFTSQLPAVKWVATQGGIVTFSYHMRNLLTGAGFRSDGSRAVAALLPGATHHSLLLAQLDSIASFAHHATIAGKSIPIIFRPWHEHTGAWFWWGTSDATETEFVQLWQFTVHYLRDIKQVHNILYAYSPSKPADQTTYNYRNPGADYIDIAGMDYYGPEASFAKDLIRHCTVTVDWAEQHHKIAAITEFGIKKGIQNASSASWFIEGFLKPLVQSKVAGKLSYCLTWHNSENNFWTPLPDNIHYPAFVEFYKDPYTLFLKDLSGK